MLIRNVRCFAPTVILMFIALGCGGSGGSSPTAPSTPTYTAPAPVTVTEYRVTAERTSLKIGETTTLTKKKIYSDQSVVSIGCNNTSGTIVTLDTQCTVTAVGAGTKTSCWTDSASGKQGCVTFTVAPIATTIEMYKTTGGPNGFSSPYWWSVQTVEDYSYGCIDYDDFGGYEGHLKNTGDGCAKNVSWTFYVYDSGGSLVEYDSDSLASNLVLFPGAVVEFQGCGLKKVAKRKRDNGESFTANIALDWTDVAC